METRHGDRAMSPEAQKLYGWDFWAQCAFLLIDRVQEHQGIECDNDRCCWKEQRYHAAICLSRIHESFVLPKAVKRNGRSLPPLTVSSALHIPAQPCLSRCLSCKQKLRWRRHRASHSCTLASPRAHQDLALGRPSGSVAPSRDLLHHYLDYKLVLAVHPEYWFPLPPVPPIRALGCMGRSRSEKTCCVMSRSFQQLGVHFGSKGGWGRRNSFESAGVQSRTQQRTRHTVGVY